MKTNNYPTRHLAPALPMDLPLVAADVRKRTPPELKAIPPVTPAATAGFWLLLLLLVAGFPAAVRAQYSFTTSNGMVTIVGYSGAGGSIVIPDTIGGFPVTTIAASAFFGVSTLTSVTLGTNLTTIGANAFFQCQALTNVNFTASVTNIGVGPFADCESLKTITMSTTNAYIAVSNNVIYNKTQTSLIQVPCGMSGTFTVPASVTNAGQAFLGNGLTAIAVNAANPIYSGTNGVFFDKAQTQLIAYPGFASGPYTVPSTVTTIVSASFEYAKGVTAITIGPGVSSIGYVAFFYCPSLTSFTVNPANGFFTTTNGVLFDKNITQLIQYPLTVGGGYVVPGTVTNIATGAFAHAAITSVVIPDSVTDIGLESFYVCQSLANVTLGDGVTNIEQQAFFYCPALKSIVIPPSVKTLSAYAFGACQNLTNACFEGNQPVDGGSVFYIDTSLTSVLHVSGATGWGSFYDGIPTAPCATCGSSAPELGIIRSGANVVLFWSTNFPGYTLQSVTNLVLTNWSTVSPAPVIVGSLNTVTNQPTGTRKFYRLSK